jgi:probable rRNA maturation factor
MMNLEPPRKLIDSLDPWRALGLSRAGLGRFLRAAQAAVGLRGEMAVLLSDDRKLRRLNREFRGKDVATDVLSFPAAKQPGSSHVGDLAISLETAQRQASQQGHSLRDEVRVLLLHGVLHLAGMDHERDRGEMAAREAELRRRFGLPSGLIERSGKTRASANARALNAKGAKVQRKERKGKQSRRGVAA